MQSKRVTWRKHKVEKFNTMMADLPNDRLNFEYPSFVSIGFDYFIPFYV